MTKHKESQSGERAGLGSKGSERRGGVIDREKTLNPALATVCAFAVCSKGSRHNNPYNPATFEKPKRWSWSDRLWVFELKRGGGSRERGGWIKGGRKKSRGCPVGERKMSAWNEKQHESLLAVSHEILPSTNSYSTKRVLALEVLSRRDLHYEHGLMKEELRGA